MLIVALVLAVIGLAALVTAVVTSNEVVAWVCIGASSLGVVLLIVDAIRERQDRRITTPAVAGVAGGATTEVIEAVESTEVIEAVESTEVIEPVDYADESLDADTDYSEEAVIIEDHPEELVHDEPDYDTYSDDEQEFPEPAEEAALHTVDEDDLDQDGLDQEYGESVDQRGDR